MILSQSKRGNRKKKEDLQEKKENKIIEMKKNETIIYNCKAILSTVGVLPEKARTKKTVCKQTQKNVLKKLNWLTVY